MAITPRRTVQWSHRQVDCTTDQPVCTLRRPTLLLVAGKRTSGILEALHEPPATWKNKKNEVDSNLEGHRTVINEGFALNVHVVAQGEVDRKWPRQSYLTTSR